jgi:hypothetical protein
MNEKQFNLDCPDNSTGSGAEYPDKTAQDIPGSVVLGEPKRGPGAPVGNANAFKHGATVLRDSGIKKKLRRAGKRLRAANYCDILSDLGGEENTSTAERMIAYEAAQCYAMTRQIDKAIEQIIKAQPKILANPSALAKLDSFRRPVAIAMVSHLKDLGLQRRPRDIEGDPIKRIQAERKALEEANGKAEDGEP